MPRPTLDHPPGYRDSKTTESARDQIRRFARKLHGVLIIYRLNARFLMVKRKHDFSDVFRLRHVAKCVRRFRNGKWTIRQRRELVERGLAQQFLNRAGEHRWALAEKVDDF